MARCWSLQDNTEERYRAWLAICQDIVGGLKGTKGATVALVDGSFGRGPVVELTVQEDQVGFSARDLVKRLQDGDPSVHASHARVRDGIVAFGPTCMKAGDAAVVVERVRGEFSSRSQSTTSSSCLRDS